MEINIQLPLLTFNSEQATPNRISSHVIDLVKKEAPILIKDLFRKNPGQLLGSLAKGLLNFAGNAGELVKDLLARGFKLGVHLVKDLGSFFNNLVDTEKALAKTVEYATKTVAEAAKLTRETAQKTVETARKTVQHVSKVAEKAGRILIEAGKDLAGAVAKVTRLDSAVQEAKRIFQNKLKELTAVVNRIAKIASQIAFEIARRLRNFVRKPIKIIGRWFRGKRSIHRRDALSEEKKKLRKKKRKLTEGCKRLANTC